MKTAIEWLIEKHFGSIENCTPDFRNKIKEAKEMEKEHLCYFYNKGGEAEINNPYVTNIEFYNKTFNKIY